MRFEMLCFTSTVDRNCSKLTLEMCDAGVYADPDSLRSTLSTKYEGFTQAEVGKNEKLFADVTESDVGLTVRLVIVYKKLKIGSIRSAFEESVGKGLKKFSGGDENKELLQR